ncbi:MAG: PhoH family protein [Lachnospiraceae bacterium]|nr:PhoH family protein [Lachnospiraceae bacterium]MCR5211192.1 PhoH family protein [Lachnospiraceae bacterium]
MGTLEEKEIYIPDEHLKNIFGEFDKNLSILEKKLSVSVVIRDGKVKLLGTDKNIKRAESVLSELLELSKSDTLLTPENVSYALTLDDENLAEHDLLKMDSDIIAHTVSGKPIKPKTIGQKNYVDLIRNNMVTFGVGPAGTGKTYLAMALACLYFGRGEVDRIILTRPAIEAGEKLGFLPGDLQSKVDPYLRPLYDALYQIMGQESFQRNTEKGLIEVAPLAYMRGRTLDSSFIILDEAQNTTPAQMKMFLTRIGFGSKAVITGDLTQKDLPKGQTSGLSVSLSVLKGIEGIGVCCLKKEDVVRHPLVQKIVEAYEEYENKQTKTKAKRFEGSKDKRR